MPDDGGSSREENEKQAPSNVRPFIRPIAVLALKTDRSSASHPQEAEIPQNDGDPGPSAA